ncbi:unnamed protein product, partial [Polarella glacialis]
SSGISLTLFVACTAAWQRQALGSNVCEGHQVCEGMGETCGAGACCSGMGTQCGDNSRCDGMGTHCGAQSFCS